MRKGIGVSPGVAVGTAYCIEEIYVNPDTKKLAEEDVYQELAKYDLAKSKTVEDLRALQKKVTKQIGQKEADIFAAHEAILNDPAFNARIHKMINDQHHTAQAALHNVMNEYSSLFARTKDDYFRQRLADVRDVIVRLSGYLSDIINKNEKLDGPIIIVADELLPSQVITLGDQEVSGVVTQTGGRTSHAAILARSRGIPAVCGVSGILKQIKTGDPVIVDGREGQVIIRPDTEAKSAYLKLQREYFSLRDHLAENRKQPALTADGTKIQLLANINSLADTKTAKAMGASGVGLYRTEYLYLTHHDLPDENEQFKIYCEMIKASPNHSITIRTLDIGGDKTVPYLGIPNEANPFLGWRSIRLSFEHPELFNTQIRAILRAVASMKSQTKSKQYDVKILFPMITTLEELRKVRMMVRRAKVQLTSEKVKNLDVALGLMLEVPAAAITIDTLIEAVDFVSIGSNDLVQYLMAADRDNPKVSHLCQPLSLAVLRVLHNVITICRKAGKPVTLCGEMAGSPRAFILLLGMGLRQFSMSPSFIPSIKQLASCLTITQATHILHQVMKFKTTARITKFMNEELEKIAPDLKLLDTAQ